MKRLVCLVVLFYAGLVLASFSMAGAEAKDLATTVCVQCHSTERICRSLGFKDQAAWTSTLARMVDNGAALDSSQQSLVAEYLATLKPGSAPLCK
jgi:mono/diheme cytochrome c family protein